MITTHTSIHLQEQEVKVDGYVHTAGDGSSIGIVHLGKDVTLYAHDPQSLRHTIDAFSRVYNELLIAEADALTDRRAAIGLTWIEQESDRLEAKRQQEREARALAALRAKLLADGDDAA